MMFPKVTTALVTSIIISLLLPALIPVSTDFTYFQNSFMYALYGVPVIFTYGILTSMLADRLSLKTKWMYKRTLSFFYHIGFGAAFVLPYALIFDLELLAHGIYAFAISLPFLVCAAVFFAVNEVIMKIDSSFSKIKPGADKHG